MSQQTLTAPDFTKLYVLAGGSVFTDALAEHRVLTAMYRHTFFVIAHADDRDAALTVADQHVAEQEGLRPVYTILLTAEHLTAIAANLLTKFDLNIAVLDAQNGHQPAPTAITARASTITRVRTEHGTATAAIATSRDLRRGDLYTDGNYIPAGDGTFIGLRLYRALADYDPTTGRVEHHIVARHWDTASDTDKRNLTGALTGGPDNLVYRLVTRTRLLDRLAIADIAN